MPVLPAMALVIFAKTGLLSLSCSVELLVFAVYGVDLAFSRTLLLRPIAMRN